MEKNKMQMWVLGVVALVIVVGIGLIFMVGDQRGDNQESVEPESVQDVSDQDVGAGAAPISYAQALLKYADRRIQLDKQCQAYPNNVTYKDNTGIMIDNRSPQTRTVKVGTTFTIKPWGFKIVVLPDIYLKTQTLLVDCDGSQNVATVLVQE